MKRPHAVPTEQALEPIKTTIITPREFDEHAKSSYTVRTIVPVLAGPYTNTYVLEQWQLQDLFSALSGGMETVVSVKKNYGTHTRFMA